MSGTARRIFFMGESSLIRCQRESGRDLACSWIELISGGTHERQSFAWLSPGVEMRHFVGIMKYSERTALVFEFKAKIRKRGMQILTLFSLGYSLCRSCLRNLYPK